MKPTTSSSNKRKKIGTSNFFQKIFKRSKTTSNDSREKFGLLQTIQNLFRRKPKKEWPESKSKDTSTNLNAVSDDQTNKNARKSDIKSRLKDKISQSFNAKDKNQKTRGKSEIGNIQFNYLEKNQIADKNLSIPSTSKTNETRYLESKSSRISNQENHLSRLSQSLPNKARTRKAQPPQIDDTKIILNKLEVCNKFSFNSRNENEFDKSLPIGFENPIGYCYLNSVVQVIVSCQDFINDFEAYDKWNSCADDTDTLFVRALFDLIRALRRRNPQQVAATLKTVQFYVTESVLGDDVYKSFMNLLTRISRVIKCGSRNTEQPKLSMPVTRQEKADVNFKKLENRNHGFVFNNFYGQITFQTICKICNKICNESFQMIKSLPLPVPITERSVSLNYCINLFLKESDVEVESPMKCDCSKGTFNLKSVTRITHAPKYLFTYLNRGSYNEDGEKNETTVTCDHTIEIETTTGFKKYKLISVIDHIGSNSCGHYYCKCNYETYNWYLLNDTHVKLISKKEVVTKEAIVFLLKQI